MNGRKAGSARFVVIAGIAGVVLLGGILAGVFITKSKRAAYVRETLALLPAAETGYADGRFAEAARTAGDAVNRHITNPTWFEAGEESRIRETSTFLEAQLALWKRVEACRNPEPAKTRADLEGLLKEAHAGRPRTNPLVVRIEPLLGTALALECEQVESLVGTWIPEARKAYEEGSWDALRDRLARIKASIATLPDVTRDAAARKLEAELKPVESLAASVSAMRDIRGGKDDGFVKADRLRGLIPSLTDLKGRDQSLHRELRKAIAEADLENRKPVKGLKMKEGKYRELAEAFAKGNNLERLGNTSDTTVIEFQGPAHRYAIKVAGNPPQFLVEVDRVRLAFSFALIPDREALSLQTAAELSRALRATRHPRAFAEEAWVVASDAPGICAFNIQDKKLCVIVGGRLFEGTVEPEPDSKAMVDSFRAAAEALEKAVRESSTVPEEIKGPVAALLKAAHTRAPPADHLDGQYCREAVQDRYLESHLPAMDDRVTACLKEYRRAYGEIIRLRSRFDARSSDGASVALFANLENDSVWRLIDPVSKTTTFSSIPRDGMGTGLSAASVFAGAHQEFPGAEPVEVRMSQGIAGVVSRWTSAGGRLEFDPARWSSGVTLGEIPEHYGTGAWQVPPHALKVDARGQARELILPSGRLNVAAIDDAPAGAQRRAAQEKFLQRCSEVLHTPGEYHLFYRYFVQYVLDSPVTTATTLIGSSRHCGDAHQDAYQTLDRRLNGKFLADCDDLAELYWTVLRRQNRPAFVLGVPGHATCGIAEKNGDGWTFFCVDTGPARQLQGNDLDDIIEKLLRTYDRDGSMSFDPRQMRFLFRFGGEQTRSDYFLDSRILRDPEYADLMIRVQEYWHFGFYALGIETMSKVLESDRMPANCQEIAGLYTRVGLWPDALKWTQAGIDGLEAKDLFTGLNDSMRVVQCLREMKRKDEAAAVLKTAAERIARVLKSDPGQADRYRGLKFAVAAQLSESDLPWDGWSFIKEDVAEMMAGGHGAESLMAMVSKIYQDMNDAVRAGAAATDAQKSVMREVGGLLDTFFAAGCFEADDSNLDVARKYGQYFGYKIAVMGLEKATAELLKPGVPDEKQTALSWPLIRLSPVAYLVAAGNALEKDEPGAGGPKVAIDVIRALEAALPEIRRQGSLGTLEFQVLDLRLLRGCFEMDEKAIRGVFEEMKRQGWGALYESLSGSLGRAAEFMKVQDFEKVFRIYCEYGVPRRHYYGVVYAASAVNARPHALAASKICIEKFPDDADMLREHALLQKLSK